MKYIKGKNRSQISLFPVSLDQAINGDNEVRLIDVFVDSLNLEEFGFRIDHGKNGRPAYHPSDLLKLFIYGYLNQLRSSRKPEKECQRNIELMWLLKTMRPDHNTIANFRCDNPKAIKKVFRETVKIVRDFNLIGRTLIAGNSTKLRAQNDAGKTAYRFRNYTTPKCKSCEIRPLCTKSAVNGKQVWRSEFARNIENNKKRVQESEKLYIRRQAIVEHPFGTIKRQWGSNYIITKSI